MAESTFTQTGVQEMRALYANAPQRVDTVCARAARGAANAMLLGARRRLSAPSPATKGPHIHKSGESLAEAIDIVEDLPGKQIRVVSHSPSQYPANLVFWWEHGTAHQPARPYMRPSADEQRAPYARDLATAIDGVARELA